MFAGSHFFEDTNSTNFHEGKLVRLNSRQFVQFVSKVFRQSPTKRKKGCGRETAAWVENHDLPAVAAAIMSAFAIGIMLAFIMLVMRRTRAPAAVHPDIAAGPG